MAARRKAAIVEEPVVVEEKPLPRTLKVLHNYVGSLTDETYINAGVYQEDDPVLWGLGEYLVETIHDAVWV